MQALLIAAGLVALVEIGDKTQLLAFMLAARFKRPMPIVLGIFVTTAIAFFLAEMGDKPQIATAALAARFPADFIGVVAGTAFGMMAANVPAVLVGGKLAERLVHRVAAVIFAVLGVVTLVAGGALLG